MKATAAPTRVASTRFALWLIVGCGLLLLAAANIHLVYVATTTEPGCVAHAAQGKADAARGRFAAAQSSCTPR
jgi:hypothetical protein